jgi:hypothetical protein
MESVFGEKGLRLWSRWADFGLPSIFGFLDASDSRLTSVPESLETVEEDSMASCGLNVFEDVFSERLYPRSRKTSNLTQD